MIIYVNNYDVGIEALPTTTITLLLLLLLLTKLEKNRKRETLNIFLQALQANGSTERTAGSSWLLYVVLYSVMWRRAVKVNIDILCPVC